MSDNKINEVMRLFAEQAKVIYGQKLSQVVLYGSCARGDYSPDSDIDVLLLMNVQNDELAAERNKIFDLADELDLKYDVVLTPVLQSIDVFNTYLPVSSYYQNIAKEGVRYA